MVIAKLLIYGLTRANYTIGCDGVAVSTVGCGPAGPGSSPGHGPNLSHIQVIFIDLVTHLFDLGSQIFDIVIPDSDD